MWSMTPEAFKKVVKCSILLVDDYFLPTQELLTHPVISDPAWGGGGSSKIFQKSTGSYLTLFFRNLPSKINRSLPYVQKNFFLKMGVFIEKIT